MKKLTIEETYQVMGGASITSSMFNAISNAVSTLFDFGRAVGSSIRRVISGALCQIN